MARFFCQPVTGRSDHHQVVVQKRRGFHSQFFRNLAHDQQVVFAVGQALQHFFPVGDEQAWLHLRIALYKNAQQVRHEVFGGSDHGDV